MTQPTTHRPRVLICDDDPMLPRLLRRYLESHGFEVRVAPDGDAAIVEAHAASPDVILVDLQLPRRDGYCVLLHLRGQAATRRTPVFVVSAEPGEQHRDLAVSLGATAYLEKPFEPAQVLAMIGAATPSAAVNAGPGAAS